jgi:hypothetical protein
MFSIFCKSPELLLDRSSGLVDFESVLSQLPGDSEHIGWTPCEDVSADPEEAGEREFLFGVEVGLMMTSLDASGRPRQTFLTVGLGSKAVLVRFWSGT